MTRPSEESHTPASGGALRLPPSIYGVHTPKYIDRAKI